MGIEQGFDYDDDELFLVDSGEERQRQRQRKNQ